VPMMARGWDMRSGLLAMRRRDGGGLAIDGTEVLVDHRRRIVEGHVRIGAVGWCWWEWLSEE